MTSSESDEEVPVPYGTPLEPFEDEVPLKKRSIQQQEQQYAVDDHGRRRFHGAFTGGFSAGYGNTVGTPEGWTPSSFKSSRMDKAQISQWKPEDFMDEEDRSEFGIAPRLVTTHREFSGQKRPRQQRFFDGPIPGEPVLEQLLRPVHETAAVRMLKAMGWREGQGVGERLTSSEKRKNLTQHKVYGCHIPSEIRQTNKEESEDSTDSDVDYDALFAPDDYEPYVTKLKNDRFGLGYSGLSRRSVLGNLTGEYGAGTSKSHLHMRDKGKKVSIRGQAFGVGAMEEDDEDIYALEDMSHYDFAIGGADSHKEKEKIQPNRSVNLLEGFVKSSKPLPSGPVHPPPTLPRDYVPIARGSRFDTATHTTRRDQGLGRHELTAEARGEMLGERRIDSTSNETKAAELIPTVSTQTDSQINKPDPIAKVAGRNVNFISSTSICTNETANKELDFIPINDSGNEFKRVFKPFVSNPQKQKRYERYLDNREVENDVASDKLSKWERERELVEFEQAAKLYKPLTGVIADRFTHASQPDEGALNPLCAVAKSSTGYGLVTPEQFDAAKRGVYGVMTRRTVSWKPDALICKRFNVPEPNVIRSEVSSEEKPKVSYSIFSYMESSVNDKESFAKEQSKFSGSKSLTRETINKSIQDITSSGKKDAVNDVNNTNTDIVAGFTKRLTTAELFLKESERDLAKKDDGVEVTDTINKFDKMDLYKSIFLSDSEEEPDPNKGSDHIEFIDKAKNVERNTSPPRGIFANIDFDELNSWKKTANNKTTEENTKSQSNMVDKNNAVTSQGNEERDIYGPKIPEDLKARLEQSINNTMSYKKPVILTNKDKSEREKCEYVDSSSSADSWIDVKEVKRKKEKKKKSKKNKSKHKKKKHKR